MKALKAALKEVGTLADAAAQAIIQGGSCPPLVPFIFHDPAHSGPAAFKASVTRALLLAVSSSVFGTFRQSHLLATGILGEAVEADVLCCQLKVEKQRAEAWLRLLPNSSTVQELSCQGPVSSMLQELVKVTIDQFESYHLKLLQWEFSSKEDAYDKFGPVLHQLVLAAMRAQVTASVMHSRLLQLIVPGWCSAPLPAGLSNGAPFEWRRWAGVLMFDCSSMERGGSAKAASDALLQPGNVPAAVFCQEVGLVQLASSVTDLPEYAAVSAECAAAGASNGSTAILSKPAAGAKVLKKPRMFVAA